MVLKKCSAPGERRCLARSEFAAVSPEKTSAARATAGRPRHTLINIGLCQVLRALMASTASNGALGYWPEPSDVVSSDPAKNSSSKGLVSPPSGWPKCFSENATLKALLGKTGLFG